MIPPRIKALFQFIEFLHSNIDNFNQYNDLIKQAELLFKEKDKLNRHNNYKDKLQYDTLQAEFEKIYNAIQSNIGQPIKTKIAELNLCYFEDGVLPRFPYLESEIFDLTQNFNESDVSEIFKYKSLYFEYRNSTHKTFFSLQFFFNELDEMAKRLFDFFKDTTHNEFEPFETKAVQVNDIADILRGFKDGQTKFVLPLSTQNQHPQKETPPPVVQEERLIDLITHSKSVEIVAGIKTQYKNIRGKRLKLLLSTLQDLGLIPRERIAKKFHDCCKKEFDWDIAKYQAMNDYNYNEHTDSVEFDEMKGFIQALIKQ